jgi:hypothetical protein
MEKCKCGGSYKITTSEMPINTRNKEVGVPVIENLSILKCNVCGNVIIPEESKFYIELIRNKNRSRLEEETGRKKTKNVSNQYKLSSLIKLITK